MVQHYRGTVAYIGAVIESEADEIEAHTASHTPHTAPRTAHTHSQMTVS
jgi:hypothetical protein